MPGFNQRRVTILLFMHRTSLLLVILLALSLYAKGQEVITLSTENPNILIGKYLYYYEDSTRQLTIEAADTLQPVKNFIATGNDRPNLGFTESANWFRFQVQNSSGVDDWMLEIAYPNFDYVELYYKSEAGEWASFSAGDMVPFYDRPIPHRNFVFPLPMSHSQVRTFYLKVITRGFNTYPVFIKRNGEIMRTQARDEIFYGMYYGLMIIMCLYNLLIFFSLQDKNYLYFSLIILSSAFYIGNVHVHCFQYFWPNSPVFQHQISAGSLGILFIFCALFARQFLETSNSLLSKYLWFLMGFSAFLVLLSFVYDFTMVLKILNLFSMLICGSLIVAGFSSLKKGNKGATYFIIAFSSFLISGIIFPLRSFGIIADNFFTQHLAEFGSMSLAIMLAFALTEKYRNLSLEKRKAQEETQRVLKEANEQLEGKVLERTKEIEFQKEEIMVQNEELHQQQEEIMAQRDFIERKNNELEQKNLMITDSIRYAKDIQQAILPLPAKLSESFPDHFVLFRPRDIVSGDFYWFLEKDGLKFLAAVDCTGHGVPGAFMSMIGFSQLNKIVVEENIKRPDLILSRLHHGIRLSLKQEQGHNADGMDMAICVIDPAMQLMEFAGAKNPIIYYQFGKRHELRGSKRSIGGMQREEERKYDVQIINISVPTTFYLFSDGYQDQAGGAEGKKFSSVRFRELLDTIQHLPFTEQKNRLATEIDQWIDLNKLKQRDDILVMGFRV